MQATEYVDWLSDVLTGQVRIRGADASAPLIQHLRAFYDGLPTSERFAFEAGLIQRLEATAPPPSGVEALNVLLNLVAYAKPLGAKAVLEKLLTSGELSPPTYDAEAGTARGAPRGAAREVDLEALAVAVHVEFGVPDWLVDLLTRRLRERPRFSLARAAFQALSLRSDASLAVPFDTMCRTVTAEDAGVALERAYFVVGYRAGMRRVLPLLTDRSLETLLSCGAEVRRWMLGPLASVAGDVSESDEWAPAVLALAAAFLGDDFTVSLRIALGADTVTRADAAKIVSALERIAKRVGTFRMRQLRQVAGRADGLLADNPRVDRVPYRSPQTGLQVIWSGGQRGPEWIPLKYPLELDDPEPPAVSIEDERTILGDLERQLAVAHEGRGLAGSRREPPRLDDY